FAHPTASAFAADQVEERPFVGDREDPRELDQQVLESRASRTFAEERPNEVHRLSQADGRCAGGEFHALLVEPSQYLIHAVASLLRMRVLIEKPGSELLVRLRHLLHYEVDLAGIRLGETEVKLA